MKQCQRCLMQEGRFAVKINDQGICNYCTYWDTNKAKFLDYKELQSRRVKKLSKHRGEFHYDALVGLSGGKDSTYIAYILKKEYGLNILAVTYDNGFLSDVAKRNIQNLVKKLGIAHYFHYPNWEVHKTFYKVAFERMGDPCIACAISGYFLATKVCYEKKIPIFFHGRSPFQMFRNYYEGSKDVFIPTIEANLQDVSFEEVARLYAGMETQIKGSIEKFFLDEEKRQKVYDEFFLDSSLLNKDFAPEFTAYFLFEPYDDESIKDTIVKNVGWERCGEHSDCRIHEAAAHMYNEVHGTSILTPEVAVMLRRGLITKKEAANIIAGSKPHEAHLNESVDMFCSKLDITHEFFEKTLAGLKQRSTGKFDSH